MGDVMGASRAVVVGEPAATLTARGLLLTGAVDPDRLATAILHVADHMPALRVRSLRPGSPVASDQPHHSLIAMHDLSQKTERDRTTLATQILRQDAGSHLRQPPELPARFHIIRLSGSETMLAVVASDALLDAKSMYAILGAGILAYFDRFRPQLYVPWPVVPGRGSNQAEASQRRRMSWWTSAFEERPRATTSPRQAPPQPLLRAFLNLSPSEWGTLSEIGGDDSAGAALAVVALYAKWLADCDPDLPSMRCLTWLDLRDLAGAASEPGTTIGPLTDRILFDVDLMGVREMSVVEVVGQTRSALLKSALRYVPFSQVRAALASEDAPDEPVADVFVRYCRGGLQNSATKGEASLAALGLSVEILDETELLPLATSTEPRDAESDLFIASFGTGARLVLDRETSDTSHPENDSALDYMQRILETDDSLR